MVHHLGQDARGLDDRALRREVAEQDRQPAARAVRIVQRADAPAILALRPGHVLVQRLAGHRHRIRVEDAGPLEQLPQDGRHPARAIHVLDVVVGRRRHLADVRHALGHLVQPGQRVVYARLLRQRERVQDRVGRAAHRHVQRERVVDGLRRHNVARAQVHLDKPQELGCRALCQLLAARIDGQDRAVARQREPQRLAQAVHRVGREHAGAGAARRASSRLQLVQLRHGNLAAAIGPDALKDVHQVHDAARRGFARLHRPAADEDGRHVQAHRRHQHPRHNLVAVGDADHAVEPVGSDHGFHRVRDQLPAGKAVLHPDVAHRDAVIDTDRIEHEGHATRCAHRRAHDLPELLQVNVAGNDVGV